MPRLGWSSARVIRLVQFCWDQRTSPRQGCFTTSRWWRSLQSRRSRAFGLRHRRLSRKRGTASSACRVPSPPSPRLMPDRTDSVIVPAAEPLQATRADEVVRGALPCSAWVWHRWRKRSWRLGHSPQIPALTAVCERVSEVGRLRRAGAGDCAVPPCARLAREPNANRQTDHRASGCRHRPGISPAEPDWSKNRPRPRTAFCYPAISQSESLI